MHILITPWSSFPVAPCLPRRRGDGLLLPLPPSLSSRRCSGRGGSASVVSGLCVPHIGQRFFQPNTLARWLSRVILGHFQSPCRQWLGRSSGARRRGSSLRSSTRCLDSRPPPPDLSSAPLPLPSHELLEDEDPPCCLLSCCLCRPSHSLGLAAGGGATGGLGPIPGRGRSRRYIQ